MVLAYPPKGELFPTDQLLGYNLHWKPKTGVLPPRIVIGPWGTRRLVRPTELTLSELVAQGISSLLYRDHKGDMLALPSFYLRKPGSLPLKLLHGSCRKPHGGGEDSLAVGDRLIELHHAREKSDLHERPGVLFLTGDQIYADDVAPQVLARAAAMSEWLLGFKERVPSGKATPRSRSNEVRVSDVAYSDRRRFVLN